jgi:diacylglycerol kinase (ATP)
MKKLPFHRSVKNALRGLILLLKYERNFQIEFIALIINIFMIIFLKLNTLDTSIIFIVCSIVLSLEIINTAIEKICDFIQPNHDERIKTIKDISAASVLLASFLSIITGGLIYSKYIFAL